MPSSPKRARGRVFMLHRARSGQDRALIFSSFCPTRHTDGSQGVYRESKNTPRGESQRGFSVNGARVGIGYGVTVAVSRTEGFSMYICTALHAAHARTRSHEQGSRGASMIRAMARRGPRAPHRSRGLQPPGGGLPAGSPA